MQSAQFASAELIRYSGHLSLGSIGLAGQQRLKNSSAVIIGAGGLGCPALTYLAAAGIGKLGIVDDDVVELSNLQRQVLYRESDIGNSKATLARDRASDINPNIRINSYEQRLTQENAIDLVQEYDIIIDATDNAQSRYVLNNICLDLKKPWIYASVVGFKAQIALFDPSSSDYEHDLDYASLFPDIDARAPACATAGILAPLPGVVGSIQASESVKYLLNIGSSLSGRLLVMDLFYWRFVILDLRKAI